jgi:hypothetical protein
MGTVTWKNCVAVSVMPSDFSTDGTSTIVASNNCSGDATADDHGGTGDLVSQTAASLFANTAGFDFRPKNGSPLVNGGTDLSGNFTTDIMEATRPIGAAFDIGAFESAARRRVIVVQ